MNDQFQFFLGVDVSKSTLDFVLLGKAGTVLQRGQIANDESSWENLIQLLDRSPSWQATLDVPQTLICAEFTGMYTYHVTAWVGRGAQLWLQSGKEIKHSQGIVRGKDDQTDAWRIAHYAKTKVDKVQLWKPLSETLETLRLLLSLRDRLLKAKTVLLTPLTEQKAFVDPQQYALLEQITKPGIESLEEQIKQTNVKIKELIDNDDELRKTRQQLESIPGVGPVVATSVIAKTGGLKLFTKARKLACQAGIAPFKYRSGTTIRGKTAVSHHADKELKRLLHLAALAAVKVKGRFKDYYERKLKEGKPKMLILNNVRNKIVQTMYAVVKNNILYDENFKHELT